jgi:integrase/recombinase XerD
LGLRLQEVLALQLDDVDWPAGDIVINGKGGYVDRMAFPADVAAALTEYIEQDRPATSATGVFVDHKAPFGTLTSATQLHRQLGEIFEKLGIKVPARTGTRVFRHTYATRSLNGGKSLAEVANLLRHRRLNTTMIYARTDLNRLREVARPWPLFNGRAK